MPISTFWDNEEKTIIRCLLEGIWGWDELIDQHAQAQAVSEGANFPLCIIIDMSESNYIPSESSRYFKLLLKDFSPYTERVIFVDANNYMKKLIHYHARSMDDLRIQHTTDLQAARMICIEAQSGSDYTSPDAATTR